MFKKEFLLVFVVLGLAMVYVLFALLVFITRGKSSAFLNKKLAVTVAIITFTGIMNSVTPSFSQEVTAVPLPTALYGTMPPATPDPKATAEPTIDPNPTATPEVVPLYGVILPDPTPDVTPVVMPLYGIMTPDPQETAAPVALGDVNSNGSVDIVDALLIAQYYIGLTPPNFNVSVADVNASGQVDIVDALLVAQKYIGLIDKFPNQP